MNDGIPETKPISLYLNCKHQGQAAPRRPGISCRCRCCGGMETNGTRQHVIRAIGRGSRLAFIGSREANFQVMLRLAGYILYVCR